VLCSAARVGSRRSDGESSQLRRLERDKLPRKTNATSGTANCDSLLTLALPRSRDIRYQSSTTSRQGQELMRLIGHWEGWPGSSRLQGYWISMGIGECQNSGHRLRIYCDRAIVRIWECDVLRIAAFNCNGPPLAIRKWQSSSRPS